jgi:ribose transport system substrate-binding protein
MPAIKSAALSMILLAITAGSLAAQEFRVGVLYWSSNIPGQVAMSKGLENEAQKINRLAP